MKKAQKWLTTLREENNSETMTGCIGLVRKYIEEASCSLADIGTSDEELKEIIKKAALQEAKELLIYAYKFKYDLNINVEELVAEIRKSIARGECSLADIGTSEEELNSIFSRKMTRKEILEIFPKVGKAKKILTEKMQESPGILFVNDLIEIYDKILSFEYLIKNSTEEKIPEELEELLEDMEDKTSLVAMMLDRNALARELLSMADELVKTSETK